MARRSNRLVNRRCSFSINQFISATRWEKSVICFNLKKINPKQCTQLEDQSEHNFVSYVAMRRPISQFHSQSGFVAGSWLTFVNKHLDWVPRLIHHCYLYFRFPLVFTFNNSDKILSGENVSCRRKALVSKNPSMRSHARSFARSQHSI